MNSRSRRPRRGARLRHWFLGLMCAHAVGAVPGVAGADVDGVTATLAREQMVQRQLAARDIADRRVLGAMRKVPRERFVPAEYAQHAYLDQPLPIGHDQTISQPYIVALMSQLARPAAGDRVLEVGTGSGYQAAVLAELAAQVYSIEIIAPLAARAASLLDELGYANVAVRSGDGYAGWPEHAPFDVIVVTAAPGRVPQPLLDQLAPGGRMVIPVGPAQAVQELRVIEKRTGGRLAERVVTPVRFVPLTGAAADRDRGG